MPSMLLTSPRRVRLYMTADSETLVTDDVTNNRNIIQWITSVSDQIENWLNRLLFIESRTEFFDLTYGRTEFRPKGIPVTTLTSIHKDITSLFDGSETLLDNTFIGANSRSVNLDHSEIVEARKAIRVIYTGGLATHPVNSDFTKVAGVGVGTVTNFVQGSLSQAVGIIVAATATTITLESFYGAFQVNDVLTQYTDIALSAGAEGIGTITIIDSQSLAESFPAIVHAAESQIRHNWKHALDFENRSTDREGNTVRLRKIGSVARPFIDEVYNMLQPHRKIELGL